MNEWFNNWSVNVGLFLGLAVVVSEARAMKEEEGVLGFSC